MEILFLGMCLLAVFMLWRASRRGPSKNIGSVDVIVPAYNEEPCLEGSLRNLLRNPYVQRVICVNDGSTDRTPEILARLCDEYGDRLVAVNQSNTGKGGALMNGVRHATAAHVFLTDADTYVPPDDGLGYMLSELEHGADAVGGIPSSNLAGAGLLPNIRATVKMPMIIIRRTFQQVLGGAPFIISGACGMFRTEVLRKHGFSDRTKVEDLDLSWTLVANGYKLRQTGRCVVYPQECNTVADEWKRWRRWVVGYAVCMRLHRGLLLSRFGIFSIGPMFLVVVMGVLTYLVNWAAQVAAGAPHVIVLLLFPLIWVAVVTVIGTISAIHHRRFVLIPLASLAVFYVILSYAIWVAYGISGLITGREPVRDKPTRYGHVVE